MIIVNNKPYEIERNKNGVYRDFEDFLKEIIFVFNIKDKLSFRNDVEEFVRTINPDGKIDYGLYSDIFIKLVEKHGGFYANN